MSPSKRVPGFYWPENSDSSRESIIKFHWKDKQSGILTAGNQLSPIELNVEETREIIQAIRQILQNDIAISIPLTIGRIELARTHKQFGISYLTSTGGWSRKNLSLEDAALFAQQLFPTHFEWSIGLHKGIVISAPHVPSETQIEFLVKQCSKFLNVGYVIAFGFRDSPNKYIPLPIGRFVHVNRPFERVESLRGNLVDRRTNRSELTFEEYKNSLENAANQKLPVSLLIELHGAKNRNLNAIQIAHNGFSLDRINELKIYSLERLERVSLFNVGVLWQGVDASLYYHATKTKKYGSLHPSVSQKSLHIEIPNILRTNSDGRDVILKFLSAILEEVITELV